MSEYRKKWRPTLQMVLFSVSLVVLLLPLGGLHFMKLYESALVRQTESELISQAAFISAAYKNEIGNRLKTGGYDDYGIRLPAWEADNDYYHPIPQTLDLADDPILPPRPDGRVADTSPAPLSRDAGDAIAPVLKEAQRMTLSGMKVLDYQGIQVAGQQETGLSFAHLPEIRKALSGESQSLLRRRLIAHDRPPLQSISRGADINVFLAAPIVLDNRLIGVVYLNRTPTDIWKTLYGKRADILTAGLLVLLVTLGITVLTSYAITRPIHKLMAQARRVASGDQQGMQLIEHPTTREIAMLSESLAGMARTIEHRSEYIRQFAMHVSHEFKTPLTAIQGSIELLQEHYDDMAPEQRRRFLDNIAQDTDRLRRLVSRLLELARAEVQPGADEVIDILPVIRPFVDRYRDDGLTVNVATAEDGIRAVISREALETVLFNLLDNSRQHGADQVTLAILLDPDEIYLRVADNGRGISDANRTRLFTPFFTTTREAGGTGLGLSIVQALLQAHGGRIRVLPADAGALFEVVLKRPL